MALILAPAEGRRARLWTEFLALFVGAPMLMAAFFGQYSLFVVLWMLAGVSAALLALTPGFRWRSLARLPTRREWWMLLGFTALTAAAVTALVFWLRPHGFLGLPRHATGLWLMIMLFYPPLSAAPQELIYRSLFFERYGQLFPGKWTAILANGLLFGFGHLFYMNPVTIGATALAGCVMGWAYLNSRSLILAWLLHAVAGCLVFTLGLGRYFYHGAVG